MIDFGTALLQRCIWKRLLLPEIPRTPRRKSTCIYGARSFHAWDEAQDAVVSVHLRLVKLRRNRQSGDEIPSLRSEYVTRPMKFHLLSALSCRCSQICINYGSDGIANDELMNTFQSYYMAASDKKYSSSGNAEFGYHTHFLYRS